MIKESDWHICLFKERGNDDATGCSVLALFQNGIIAKKQNKLLCCAWYKLYQCKHHVLL